MKWISPGREDSEARINSEGHPFELGAVDERRGWGCLLIFAVLLGVVFGTYELFA